MNDIEVRKILEEILRLPAETEWVEFKHDNDNPQEIGEYISAISNGAALYGKRTGYIVWGIEDGTHAIVGTAFRPKQARKGNELLESWLLHLLNPRIDFIIHELDLGGARVVLFAVQAARSTPVRFAGEAYVRVGSYRKKLKDFPEKERRLWQVLSGLGEDWSAVPVGDAKISDLDPDALTLARVKFAEKFPDHRTEVASWNDITFLNKAKLCQAGQVTRAALIVLGSPESAYLLSPAQAHITWVLRDENNMEKDYSHFEPPLLLAPDKVLQKIRNLMLRYLPPGTLFPKEVTQYDPWIVRELVSNCIAHQDYTMNGRISIVETPDSLLFTNLGTFIPGSVEKMIRTDAPPAVYRNPFLAQAMMRLNMIDTMGSGIKRIFTLQRKRNLPMPDYELSDPTRVAVRLTGRVIDERYTHLLLATADLDLIDVIALDRVQKRQPIDEETCRRLRAHKLIEQRRGQLFVRANAYRATGDKAEDAKPRAFDFYADMLIAYLEEFGEASRTQIDKLLLDKLPDSLDNGQRKRFVENLLQEMRRQGRISPSGTTRLVRWRIP